jgi:hypothetical protein|tara:strand:+ start:33 stop:206 length:174 start_codon:yes stop_codon:yes gene_type:complete
MSEEELFSIGRSILNKITNDVTTAKTDRILGNVLGHIGLRLMNGAKSSSIVKNAAYP